MENRESCDRSEDGVSNTPPIESNRLSLSEPRDRSGLGIWQCGHLCRASVFPISSWSKVHDLPFEPGWPSLRPAAPLGRCRFALGCSASVDLVLRRKERPREGLYRKGVGAGKLKTAQWPIRQSSLFSSGNRAIKLAFSGGFWGLIPPFRAENLSRQSRPPKKLVSLLFFWTDVPLHGRSALGVSEIFQSAWP